MTRTFVLRDAQIRQRACAAIMAANETLFEVILRPFRDKRSLEQNALMWVLLTAISEQIDWFGERLTPEEWKDLLTAFVRKQRVVPGIDGGMVLLGSRTSKMTKAEMTELIDAINWFMDEKGVVVDEHKRARARDEWVAAA